MRTESVLRRVTAYTLIWLQLLIPVLSTQPLIARAEEPSQNQSTLQGLDALILGDGAPAASATVPPAPAAAHAVTGTQNLPENAPARPALPDLSAPARPNGDAEPAASKAARPDDGQDSVLASGAMRARTLMSEDNRSEAAINYARGIGEGLINQQVNDWLNQYGHAKVSVDTEGKISGDILFPMMDSPDSLLFSQTGIRTNKKRKTANLGLGYRQYLGSWMLGVNTFYDDDYTGKNQRFGFGGEAWTDYLKLAVNGYLRQTGWHQSRLDGMEDYDERPANGFDVRANAWLPSWPNVGGSLEYDQYFGHGVSVADSTIPDSLRNNPEIVKVGLNYTPFPLLTLSAKRSVGDAHDTDLQLDLNYRFGVPLSQQTSSDAVDLMRSLTGSRYDLVDRNYDIVMQYRKQDLLHIHLPGTTVVEAAETTTLKLTVDREKYGLKDVAWTVDPALLSNGGHYKVLSPTELQVTLPAYISDGGLRGAAAQNYSISAVATDSHGNESNRAETRLGVIPSRNTISSLTISPSGNGLPANNSDSYTITGKVMDAKGAPLAGQNITFSVSGLVDKNGKAAGTLSSADGSQNDSSKITVTTAADGTVVARLRSSAAGEGTVTARMDNGNQTSVSGAFVADAATASVREVRLNDSVTRKAADGKNSFAYTARVEDANGNAVSGADVFWSQDGENVSLSAAKTTTDSDGDTGVSLRAGTVPSADIQVSAALSGASQVNADKKVSFTADAATARVTSLVVTEDGEYANGVATDAVQVTVLDANGNPVASARVGLSADHDATVGGDGTVTTDASGQATATLTSTWAGDVTVTATLGESSRTATATFVADSSTAQVSAVSVTSDGAKANGVATDAVQVTVVDANGNPVASAKVALSADHDATVGGAGTATTDTNGQATATLTSTWAGGVTVTATLGDSSRTAKATFVADSSTAQVSAVVLNGTAVSKVADGTSSFTYAVTVKDGKGNPVPGATVRPSADKQDVTVAASGATDTNGQATVTLTSTTKAVSDITVSAATGNTTKAAEKAVSFIADSSTAKVSALSVTTDGAKANGVATDAVQVTVVDANGNPVASAKVGLSADHDATVGGAGTATTDANGQATATLTSTWAGGVTVTATLGDSSSTAKATFVADSSTAQVSAVVLNGTAVSKVADGTSSFTYAVTVKDGNGNPVPGATVRPSADKQDVTVAASGATDASGQATVTLTSTTKAVSDITVSAATGNTTKAAEKAVSFIADSSTAQVSAVSVTSDGAKANGVATDAVQVTVVDANGNPVASAKVALSADHDATVGGAGTATTDTNGQATATLTSTWAGGVTVTATLGDSSSTAKATFVADSSTAQVSAVVLNGTAVSKVADGTSSFTYAVTVLDDNGNPVPGATVTPSADKQDVTVAASGATDASGQATVTLTSTTKAVSDITVSAATGNTKKAAEKAVSFIADSSTAQVSAVSVTTDGAKANGVETDAVQVTVVDANGNPVASAKVGLSADHDATVGGAGTATTDTNGQATATLTSTWAGDVTVTATLGDSSRTATATFVADSSTAKVSAVSVTSDGAKANGVATDAVQVTVVDANGNPVASAEVGLSADHDATVGGDGTATTDTNGQATATLTSTWAGGVTVTATLGDSSSTAKATFVADSSTAQVSAVVLNGTAVSKVADGTSSFTYAVTVKDSNGNPVPGATVTPSADKQHVTVAASGATDTNGQATVTLTSTTKAVSDITVSAATGNTTKAAEKAVSFIADSSTAQVSALSVTSDGAKANGVATDAVQVTVVDANGNPVASAKVGLSADHDATVGGAGTATTDTNGQATATLTSTWAGGVTVTATLGDSSSTAKATFVADSSTAQVSAVVLNGTAVSKVADGKSSFTYAVTVKDSNGNPVPGATVRPSADKQDVTVAASGATDTNGQATVTLTSTTKAVSDITVSAATGNTTKAAEKAVSFIADSSTAQVSALSVTTDSAKANGVATDAVQVTVVDANGNPVASAKVGLSADHDATVGGAGTATTDANGQATATLTSTWAGGVTVTATLGDSSRTATATFVTDSSTAHVSAVSVTSDGAKANGVETDAVQVTVVDANGNPVASAEVGLSADHDATVGGAGTATTDTNGQATATLTSTWAGGVTVTATLGDSSRTAKATFVADSSTAQVSAVVLNGTAVSKVADGTSSFTYAVTVKDGNGNPVPGATVAPSADKQDVTVAASGATDTNGQATVTLTSTTKAVSDITVSAATGNTTKAAEKAVSFIADSSTAQVSAVSVTSDGAKANGVATDAVQVTVVDANGNPVASAKVGLSADHDATVGGDGTATTDTNGQATATLTSTWAGGVTVTATLGDSSSTAKATFVADSSTAQVSAVVLNGTAVSKVADGKSSFTYAVTVKDSNGNPVPGATVRPSADKQDVTVAASGATDTNGQATVTLTSTTKAVSDITVSAATGNTTKAAEKAVSFIADSSTAQVSALSVTTDSAKANGVEKDAVQVTVVDANGNPVASAKVGLSADHDATVGGAGTATTDANGQATATLTSTWAGSVTVTATLGDSSRTATATFVADSSTAQVSAVSVTSDGAKANGVATDAVQVTVVDANGNPVASAKVGLSADHDATVGGDGTATTDTNGQATATLTSTWAGGVTVTATLGDSSSTAKATFVADSSTAQVSAVVLNGTAVSKVADGTSSFTYAVTVKDSNGNPVPGATVTPSADKQDVTVAASGATDTNGQATVTLTSTTKAVSDITVSAATGNTTKAAEKAVSFIADSSTAQVSALSVTSDGAKANGVATDAVQVTVVDANGNPVASAKVALSADHDATVGGAGTATTDTNGQATATLTSTWAGGVTVTATLGDSSSTAKATFVADSSTAQVSAVVLNGTAVSKVADGTSSFTYAVTVKDSNGNPVPGATVTPSADKQDVTVAASGATDASGQATVTLTSTTKAVSDITVSAATGNTKKAAEKAVSFIADSSTAQVSALSVTTDGAKANGVATDAVQVTVVDANGNPVASAKVGLSADHDATVGGDGTATTDTNGQATATLTSTWAGDVTVTATLGDSSRTAKATFVADSSTAQVSAVSVTSDGAKANGVATDAVQVTVVDANGNPVASAKVGLSADHDATVGGDGTATTDTNGQATATLTSTWAGGVTVTATLGDTSRTAKATFVADSSTAQVSAVVLNGTAVSKVADGTSSFTYAVTVLDGNGNPVPGATVTPSADKQDVTVAASGATDASGQATVTLTSTTKAVSDITVSAATGNTKKAAEKAVSFIADSSTAQVSAVVLNGTAVSKVADGTSSFTYAVTVLDGNGNPVPGATVTPSADKQDVTVAASGATDASGQATVTLTSTTKAVSDITVSAATGNTKKAAEKAVSFTAGTVDPTKSGFVSSTTRIVGNKLDFATLTLTLRDANDNPLTGESDNLSVSTSGLDGMVISSFTEDGNNQGVYEAKITGSMVGSVTLTALINKVKASSDTPVLNVYGYSFSLKASESSIIVDGTYIFLVKATPSDGGAVEEVDAAHFTSWTSSDTNIASVDSSTGLVKGKNTGNANITGSGTYKSYQFSLTGKVRVLGSILSDIYGTYNVSGDSHAKYVVEPPSYELALRSGTIIDALGTKESITGGSGGAARTLENANQLSSIDVYTGTWEIEPDIPSVLLGLVFHYKSGESISYGSQSKRTLILTIHKDVFIIPEEYILDGFDVGGAKYIHSLRFILKPNI
ncbi:Ig-like domain-containing protein [Symbiopectobacterium purcellii]|uniref:Ig-like domain-containing protein n=1 Tax=Symbiopectobacterium purcellii TaxID=2871826 RepID=UPI003F87441A